MELTVKQMEQLTAMPIISNHVTKSKDGKCIIVTTKITKIYSRKYWEVVLADKSNQEVSGASETPVEKVKVENPV